MILNKKRVIQSFGRRRSRGLSNVQKNSLYNLYEKYSIQDDGCADLHILFKEKFEKIFVEIGFGMGEHLVQNAVQNPNYAMIGCEPFENGVANVLREIEEKKLQNIRVYKDDARFLLNSFADAIINRFYVLFPDPWTKKRHHKRRLLSVDFIKLLQQKLKENGDIVVATDCKEYMDEILENTSQIACMNIIDQSLERPSWLIPTRYEQKAIENGKIPYYTRLIKKTKFKI